MSIVILKVGNQEFLKWNYTFLWILKHCVQKRERERERPTACVWWCQAVSKINVSSSREINRYHSSHQMIFPTLICPHWIPVERNHIFTLYICSLIREKNDTCIIGKAICFPILMSSFDIVVSFSPIKLFNYKTTFMMRYVGQDRKTLWQCRK